MPSYSEAYLDAICRYVGPPVEPPAPKPLRKNARGRDMDSQMRALVRAEYGTECVCCGAEAKHLHHLLPRSHGGTHSLDNLIPVCLPCHAAFHPYLNSGVIRHWH